jgi:hypothetical protein
MRISVLKILSVFSFILGAAFFIGSPAIAYTWSGNGPDTYSRNPLGDISNDVYSDTFQDDITVSATFVQEDIDQLVNDAGADPANVGFWSLVIYDGSNIQAESPQSTTTLESVVSGSFFPIGSYTIATQLYDLNAQVLTVSPDVWPVYDYFTVESAEEPEEPASSTGIYAQYDQMFGSLSNEGLEVMQIFLTKYYHVLLALAMVSGLVFVLWDLWFKALPNERREKKKNAKF